MIGRHMLQRRCGGEGGERMTSRFAIIVSAVVAIAAAVGIVGGERRGRTRNVQDVLQRIHGHALQKVARRRLFQCGGCHQAAWTQGGSTLLVVLAAIAAAVAAATVNRGRGRAAQRRHCDVMDWRRRSTRTRYSINSYSSLLSKRCGVVQQQRRHQSAMPLFATPKQKNHQKTTV